MRLEASASGKRSARPKCHVFHGWVSRDLAIEVLAEADRRLLHPDELVARLLEAVFDVPEPQLSVAALLDQA